MHLRRSSSACTTLCLLNVQSFLNHFETSKHRQKKFSLRLTAEAPGAREHSNDAGSCTKNPEEVGYHRTETATRSYQRPTAASPQTLDPPKCRTALPHSSWPAATAETALRESARWLRLQSKNRVHDLQMIIWQCAPRWTTKKRRISDPCSSHMWWLTEEFSAMCSWSPVSMRNSSPSFSAAYTADYIPPCKPSKWLKCSWPIAFYFDIPQSKTTNHHRPSWSASSLCACTSTLWYVMPGFHGPKFQGDFPKWLQAHNAWEFTAKVFKQNLKGQRSSPPAFPIGSAFPWRSMQIEKCISYTLLRRHTLAKIN